MLAASSISVQVLSMVPGLIPGIEQVILVHNPANRSELSGYLLKKESDGYRTDPIRITAGNSFFTGLFTTPLAYQWFRKDQVPFEIISKDKVQLTIFSELKNSVLLVKNVAIDIACNDLYFLYFNENLSNFVLDKVNEPFSAQHKNMVGFLVSNSIRSLSHLLSAQQQLAATFDEQIRLVVKERDQLRDELEIRSQKERMAVLSLAQFHLAQLAERMGTTASFTDSAKIKLKSFTGELYQLEGVIRQALEFAGALSSPSRSGSLLLADYHIRFPDPVRQSIPEEVIEGLPQRMVKTHLLLDRLELAATGIKHRKESLTSANVGKEFPTPVSAPAITDALRKHKKRIIQLFDQYPDKWEIIRHEFRPIQNLMNSARNQELLSAS